MDAIIFLAPISCFDEVLMEDRNVNRLEDSYLLWRTVCSSKLLAKTQIILFLNKCDLLLGKLKRGIMVKDHIRSYGNASNDAVSVTKCTLTICILKASASLIANLIQISSNISKIYHDNIHRSHDHSLFT